jgi:hypothetical protein
MHSEANNCVLTAENMQRILVVGKKSASKFISYEYVGVLLFFSFLHWKTATKFPNAFAKNTCCVGKAGDVFQCRKRKVCVKK